MKDRASRLWFEQATRILFKYRYDARSNFVGQNQSNYHSLGAFGNMTMFIDEFDYRLGGGPGLRYSAVPLGETYYRENHQGLVRWDHPLVPADSRADVGEVGRRGRFPPSAYPALNSRSQTPFNILHRVVPNTDYDPDMLFGPKTKKFASYYVVMEDRLLVEEGGFNGVPLCGRPV